LADFGISKVVECEDSNAASMIGTGQYMAPEIFQ